MNSKLRITISTLEGKTLEIIIVTGKTKQTEKENSEIEFAAQITKLIHSNVEVEKL